MALETKPTLSLAVAKKMASGCEAKAAQEKWAMNIAVVDDGANLVFFQHMDGAFKGSIYISQHKAMTSAKTLMTAGAERKHVNCLIYVIR